MREGRTTELRTLVEVVRHRSFAKAAAALGLSASAASQAIARLEARLGRALIDRTTRVVRPTPLGARLSAAAEPALDQLDDVYRLIEASGAEPGGTIRLSIPHVAMELVVGPALAGFARAHPGVVLEISVEDRLVDLAEERLDAGIRRGHLVEPTTIAHRVSPDDELLPVAAPAYLREQGTPREPADLREHRLIGIRRRLQGTVPPWRLQRGERAASVAVAGVLVVDDPVIARRAAIDGLGVAHLARAFVARELAEGSLVWAPDSWATPIAGFHLFYPRRLDDSAPLKLLRDWLVKPVRADQMNQ
jgi:DNA-binding transcriptional LysR family regulator